jgi:hypothetical protein
VVGHKDKPKVEVPEAHCRSLHGLLEGRVERDGGVDQEVEVVRQLDQRSSRAVRHPPEM